MSTQPPRQTGLITTAERVKAPYAYEGGDESSSWQDFAEMFANAITGEVEALYAAVLSEHPIGTENPDCHICDALRAYERIR